MPLRSAFRTVPALATLALSAALLSAPAAQAATVSASYTIAATDFEGGGTFAGSIGGSLVEWLAAAAPFAAGSGRMTLPDTLSFSASFSGNASLPAATFDLSEVSLVELIDNGTFGANGGQPGLTPALFLLTAYDPSSDSDLFIRFASLSGAEALLNGDPGVFIDFRGDDVGSRGTPLLTVTLQGGPTPTPLPSTLALALLGFGLLSRGRRIAAG